MGKRQERIKGRVLAKNLSKIEGREVNVVLHDGTTIHGYVISTSPTDLILEDLRFHKHNVVISEVSELVVDSTVES